VTYEILVKDLPRRFAAVVRFQARPSEMGPIMPHVYGQVMAFLGRLGVQVSGPAMAKYKRAGDAFEVEAGFYVAEAFAGGDGVTCIELPGGEAATTTHFGTYDTLAAAYDAVQAWASEQDRGLSETMSEEYWSDPQTTPPPEWRTDIIWPLK
jgi:effector-binding domain-containing protein